MNGTPWTEQQIALLREYYPDRRTEDLVPLLGHPLTGIYRKAKALQLRKSEEFLASPLSGRTDGSRGQAGRFRKGQQPWNTGTKGLPIGGKTTQFKKGQMPKNWMPIGSDRIRADGYIEVKLQDTGVTRHDFVCVHQLVWELHYGPIPAGHVVCFKDGNVQNHHPDNLELLSRVELMRRNTIHNYPEPIVKAMQLKGALVRKINRRSKDHG